MADIVRTLEKVLAEADVIVRLRLKEISLEVPHLIIAVTPDGQWCCAATSVRTPCGRSGRI